MSGCNSFSHARTTDANASLISVRSMSAMVRPARCNAFCVAGIGAVSMSCGLSPARPKFTKRARGVRPSARHFSSLMINIADAPSVIWLELPAVTRPPSSSLRNAGFSVCNFSYGESRMPSSVVMRIPSESSTGKISRSKRPSAVARAAYACERAAKRSMSSRVIPHLSAIISALMPCGTKPPSGA